MKKLFYILSCLFLLSAGFAACSCESEDPPEQPSSHQNEVPTDSIVVNNDTTGIDSTEAYTVISAVPASEEMRAFFDKALPFSYDKPAFFTPYVDFDQEIGIQVLNQWAVYSMFNSKEEMQVQYIGDADLPDVNFDKYSLIIGTSFCLNREDSYTSTEIRLYDDYKELAVRIKTVVHEDYPDQGIYYYGGFDLQPFRFWAIFPKLQGDIDRVNYMREI